MATSQTVLITAPSGHIGTELIPLLLSSNTAKLILPTSNADRLKSQVPSTATNPNAIIAEGTIKDPTWIESLLTTHAVSTVFLCLSGTDELLLTLNFFHAMHRAGCIKHLVYVSACGDFVSPEGVKRVMSVCSSEHVLVKSTIETKLLYGGFGWKSTILGPTLFFGNDLRAKKGMLEEGIFGEPLGEKGVSRVAVEDIALAASNLILNPEHKHAGSKIQLGSLKMYTGAEIAALWSKALSKEITMLPSTEEGFARFERGFWAKGVPRDWTRDLRLMGETFAVEAFGMGREEWGVQCEVLGREPEGYEGWVAKEGASWVKG